MEQFFSNGAHKIQKVRYGAGIVPSNMLMAYAARFGRIFTIGLIIMGLQFPAVGIAKDLKNGKIHGEKMLGFFNHDQFNKFVSSVHFRMN